MLLLGVEWHESKPTHSSGGSDGDLWNEGDRLVADGVEVWRRCSWALWRRARACSLAASLARSSRISSSHRSTFSLWILHARHEVSERIGGAASGEENGGQ